MRVVRRQVAQRAGCDRCQEKMGTLGPGEVVPVAIEQMSEDLRLHLARGQSFVAIRVTFVADPIVGRRDGRAIRKNRGSKEHGVPVGRPDGVSGLRRNVGQLLRIARRAGCTVEIRQPDLLGTDAAAEEKDALAIRGKLNA